MESASEPERAGSPDSAGEAVAALHGPELTPRAPASQPAWTLPTTSPRRAPTWSPDPDAARGPGLTSGPFGALGRLTGGHGPVRFVLPANASVPAAATVSLVLGIVALGMLLVLLGLSAPIAVPIAVIGVVLGIRGRRATRRREGAGSTRVADTGIALCTIAVVLGLLAAAGWVAWWLSVDPGASIDRLLDEPREGGPGGFLPEPAAGPGRSVVPRAALLSA